MEGNPLSDSPKYSYSKTPRGAAVLLIMIGLVFSPFLTLSLFHPDGAFIEWPKNVEQLLGSQVSQIEPLLLSFGLLWYALERRTVSSRLLCVATVVSLHMFVAFWLITIRGEGGLRWLN